MNKNLRCLLLLLACSTPVLLSCSMPTQQTESAAASDPGAAGTPPRQSKAVILDLEPPVAAAAASHRRMLQFGTLLGKPVPAAVPVTAGSKHKPGKIFRLEIVSGNGVAGLGSKTGEQHSTVIQYRDGFLDDAIRLSRMLQTQPVLQRNSRLRKNTDVRLILGTDALGKAALPGQHEETAQRAEPGNDAETFVAATLQLARKLTGYAAQFL